VQRSLDAPRTDGSGGARIGPTEARRRLASFAVQAKGLRERQCKAKHYFETGMAAFQAGRWLEAAASVRLALAFDPQNEAHREAFGRIQQKAHEMRAEQLVREAEAALDVRDYARALGIFEECLQFRPHDADLHHRASRLAQLGGGDLRKAKEWAALACELAPDVAPYRRTLGHEESRVELASLGSR
jgi:tetratricopeptide (TPR) repeat protein